MHSCWLVLFSPAKVNTLNEPEAEVMFGHLSHIASKECDEISNQ